MYKTEANRAKHFADFSNIAVINNFIGKELLQFWWASASESYFPSTHADGLIGQAGMTDEPLLEQIKLRQTISPMQFAQALGVSESSVKRWCDSGILDAGRTPGGHRRIPLRKAIEFARQSGRPIVSPELLGMPKSNNVTALPDLQPLLLRALLEGDEVPVRDMLLDVFVNHSSFVTAIDDLVQPVMQTISKGCHDGSIKFYEERRACSLVFGVLAELRSKIRQVENSPRACGGTLGNEFHGVGSRVVELILRDQNWNALCLGTNCPIEGFVEAADEFKPQVVWLSTSFQPNSDDFTRTCTALAHELEKRMIPLIIGGPGMSQLAPAQLNSLPHNVSIANSLGLFIAQVEQFKTQS